MNLLLALVTSVLFTLSLPRFDFTWLAPIAMTPLLVGMAREQRFWMRLLIGWLAGAAILGGVTHWIHFVVSVHGGLGDFVGVLVFAFFCVLKGFYFGVFAMFVGPLLHRWWAIPAVAAVWVAVDITIGSVGFQWVTLGNAGTNMSIPMRLAPFTGVHGLSFAFMMMSAALALVALRRPRLQLLWLLLLPLLILLPELPEQQEGAQSAVVLQPNVDETKDWTPQSLDRSERELALMSIRATLRAGARKPELLIWPEVPAPFYYYEDEGFRQLAAGLARAAGVPFLFGTVARTERGAPLNSALLLSPAGEPVARYDKIELVPFGEYVPLLFRFAGKITKEVGDFEPGTAVVTPAVGAHKIGAFICYESAFPALVRRFTQNGAEVLFNLSNDGYFGRSASAREQHLLVVRMRAAENARWIVRATNDGITAAVDPAGRVIQRLPDFRETAAEMKFTYLKEQTFYARHGNWFGWICVMVGALAIAASIRFRSA